MSIDATNGGNFIGNNGTVDFQGTTILSGGTDSNPSNSFGFSNVTVTSSLDLGTSNIKLSGNLTNNGTLNLNASYVKLSGDINNNGTFTCGNSTIEFNSTLADQNINLTGTAPTTIFNNIYINNGGGLTVQNIGADTRLQGLLSFNASAGGFSADGTGSGGGFTVLSTSLTDHAAIGTIPAGNFTGTATIQRFIDGKSGGDYRYVSMPITDGRVSIWKAAFGVTGSFSDHSTHADFANIIDAGNTIPSVYYFDPIGQAYVAVDGTGLTSDPSASIDNTKGYAVYNFRDVGNDVVAAYTGTIASGDVAITISSTGGISNNFNLIPNPYPSPVSWDAIYKSNPTAVTGAMWWRIANHQYASYVGSLGIPNNPLAGTIAIGQAFWIQSAGGSSSITIHETNKSTLEPTFVRKASPGSYVIFTLSSPLQKDYAAIRFVADGTDGHDKDWDAVKRRNGDYSAKLGRYTFINLSTFTTSSNDDYAINSVAEINGCSRTLGLKVVDVPAGNYAFGFEDLSTLQLPYNMVLVDHLLNSEKTIAEGTVYPFSVTSDAKSYGDSRFEIRFETAPKPVVTIQGQTLTSSISTGNQWYKDGQIIVGATNSTYNVTASGDYSVKTTSGGCETTSDNLTMRNTGLEEVTTSSMVYPNPTQGIIAINLPQDVDTSLTGVYLYDTQGRVMLSSEKDLSLLKEGEKSLDLTNFKAGVYILNIVSGSQVKSIRLIKK